MEQQIITVGDRQYTFLPLLPFSCVVHLARLKNIATMGINGALSDVSKILDGIDEHTLDKVIFPILKECAVTCTTDAKRLTTAAEMNALYTHENLDEFFVVVGKVLAFNFEPLLKKTLARFGIDLGQLGKQAQEKAQQKLTQNAQQ